MHSNFQYFARAYSCKQWYLQGIVLWGLSNFPARRYPFGIFFGIMEFRTLFISHKPSSSERFLISQLLPWMWGLKNQLGCDIRPLQDLRVQMLLKISIQKPSAISNQSMCCCWVLQNRKSPPCTWPLSRNPSGKVLHHLFLSWSQQQTQEYSLLTSNIPIKSYFKMTCDDEASARQLDQIYRVSDDSNR